MTLDLVRCHKSRWHVIVADHLARDSRLYPPVPIITLHKTHATSHPIHASFTQALSCTCTVRRGTECRVYVVC